MFPRHSYNHRSTSIPTSPIAHLCTANARSKLTMEPLPINFDPMAFAIAILTFAMGAHELYWARPRREKAFQDLEMGRDIGQSN